MYISSAMQDDLTKDPEVIEGEVVDETPNVAVSQTLDLTSLINEHVGRIEKLKIEMGKYKEMLDDIFQNDPTYQQHDKLVKEAQKVRNGTKKQLMKMPQAADLVSRIQEFKNMIKESNESLSGYLQEYQRSTGLFQIETSDGSVREIIYTARLIKA